MDGLEEFDNEFIRQLFPELYKEIKRLDKKDIDD